MDERDVVGTDEASSDLRKKCLEFIRNFQSQLKGKTLLQGIPRVPNYYSKKAIKNMLIIKFPYDDIPDEILKGCSSLFNANYGVWGEKGHRPNKRVQMSVKLLKELCLSNGNCSLVVAKEPISGIIRGHVFVCQFPWKDGEACWITQLVVAANARGNGLATQLVNTAIDPRALAWGLATSHPHAVRSLERATKTKCNPSLIGLYASSLVEASGIPYVQNRRIVANESGSIIDTEFFVDHTEVNAFRSKESGWHMGSLNDGEEYLAFVFAPDIAEDTTSPCFPCFHTFC